MRHVLALLVVSLLLAPLSAAGRPVHFVVKPYLQIGTNPQPDRLSLVWMGADEDADWTVSLRADGASPTPCAVSARRLLIGGAPFRQYVATLEPLQPGAPFEYSVSCAGRPAFHATSLAPPTAEGTYRAIVVGDTGDGSGSQRAVAAAMYAAAPGLVVMPGDLVYPRGTQLDYLRNFFPIFNYDKAVGGRGVPLMRSVPFVGALGNHDVPASARSPVDFSRDPDGLAYYYDWLQPLNGPLSPAARPRLAGFPSMVKAFEAAAGERFPRMGSFSFDWGPSHWLVLDSNPYVDWTTPALREWAARDLEAARGATWRFVVFHHAPFQSAYMKTQDQWMRLMADVFEKGHVDIVFSGHLHNYQRSFPIRFAARRQPNGRWMSPKLTVSGDLRIDRGFDGATRTRADGVIYIVTGGGGAPLSNSKRQSQPKRWQPFTCRYKAEGWSFTDLEVSPQRLRLRQLDTAGQELDRFELTPSPVSSQSAQLGPKTTTTVYAECP